MIDGRPVHPKALRLLGLDRRNRESWCPATMDVVSWLITPKTPGEKGKKRFRSRESPEIRRKSNSACPGSAHESLSGITFIAVGSDYQRQDIGSMPMKMFCSEMDKNGLALAISSSAGFQDWVQGSWLCWNRWGQAHTHIKDFGVYIGKTVFQNYNGKRTMPWLCQRKIKRWMTAWN